MNNKLKNYTRDNVRNRLEDADPYTVIQMLMQGVLENCNYAKGAIQRKDMEKKSLHIGKAQAILESLIVSLNPQAGADATDNLIGLYGYMSSRLMTASIELNSDIIDEVMGLMVQIKSSWDQIPAEARQEAHDVLGKLHAQEDAAHQQEVQRVASSA
ncbi:flagellar export chaperone FliS [Idiomarina seosinensis]|uniref:flagellar export chaperone FliS n=1 Tax=Idiomarina seosinensis TaxID=281739 RepID=UPI003850B677